MIHAIKRKYLGLSASGAFIVSLIFMSAPIIAQDDAGQAVVPELTEFEKAAKIFKYKELSLGLTKAKVKIDYPKNSVYDLPDGEKKQGITALYIEDVKGIDVIVARFYEDKLFSAIVIYSYDDLSDIGGGEVVEGFKIFVNKLKDKLGRTSNVLDFDEDPIVFRYEFPKVDRDIVVEFSDENEWARLMYHDLAVREKIRENAKKDADVGF